jgi:N-acetylmuramoyl-L-alanine amidase
MWILRLQRRSLRLLTIISVAAVVGANLLAALYLKADDIDGADLATLSGRTITIDPGHGGVDGGARGNGVNEKEINLAISLKLADVLRASGANVVLTRDSDIDYYTRGKGGKRNDLNRRVEIINQSGATAFVSIHINSIRGSKWFGAEVYYNPKQPENRKLAEIMQQALQDFPPGNKRQAKEDSDILVLKDTNIPGVLVETGFLSNPQEAAMLVDAAYQQKMVERMAKALAYHFSQNAVR